jgi:peptidoglycan/xylan/chitin deacetylase (PgdA/CDA1 family)
MQMLAEHFSVLPLSEAVERLREGSLPVRAASITFDDGYADNVTVALPVLQKFALPATFFISSGHLDGGRMWNDTVIEALRYAPGPALDLRPLGLDCLPVMTCVQRQQARLKLLTRLKRLTPPQRERQAAAIADVVGARLPRDLMMRSDQVRALAAAGMEIGAHTVSHPILRTLTEEQARREIDSSKQQLTEITGTPVVLFAYPNGKPETDYDTRHVEIVREFGFRAAVSTAWGVANRTTDPFQLPRFTPSDQSPTRFLARLLQNYLRGSPL